MGIAILEIVLYHMKIELGASLYLVPLKMIKAIGYGGVDLFFFLSGLGLTYGWLHKKYSISEFYRKRLIRIVPTYWLWMLGYGILQLTVFQDFKLRGFIADFLGVGFLSGKSYNNWFVPAIIVCYLIFPFIVRFFIKRGDKGTAPDNLFLMLFYASWLPLLISLFLILIKADQLLIFSTRLPTFILGIFIGLAHFRYEAQTLKDLHVRTFSLVLLLVLGFIALYLANTFSTNEINFRYGFLWYPFIVLTLPLCLLLANGLAWLEHNFSKNAVFLAAKNFLRFCGGYSLEIYLMHSLLFGEISLYLINLLNASKLLSPMNAGNVLSYLLLVVLSLGSAYLLSQTVRFFDHLLKKHIFAV